jgi:hypothetical protein
MEQPPAYCEKKEDETGEKLWRLVINYRKLNEKTVGDAYHLPDVTEILDQLGQSKYFSCIDMVMEYHQIEMASEDRAKTAFSTKEGHWEYQRLPFGLKTADHSTRGDRSYGQSQCNRQPREALAHWGLLHR